MINILKITFVYSSDEHMDIEILKTIYKCSKTLKYLGII